MPPQKKKKGQPKEDVTSILSSLLGLGGAVAGGIPGLKPSGQIGALEAQQRMGLQSGAGAAAGRALVAASQAGESATGGFALRRGIDAATDVASAVAAAEAPTNATLKANATSQLAGLEAGRRENQNLFGLGLGALGSQFGAELQANKPEAGDEQAATSQQTAAGPTTSFPNKPPTLEGGGQQLIPLDVQQLIMQSVADRQAQPAGTTPAAAPGPGAQKSPARSRGISRPADIPQDPVDQALRSGQVSQESIGPIEQLLIESNASPVEVAEFQVSMETGKLTNDQVLTLRRLLTRQATTGFDGGFLGVPFRTGMQ